MEKIKICCLSDTHTTQNLLLDIPDSDILVFAGDMQSSGYNDWEIYEMVEFFKELIKNGKTKYVVIVPGNHDRTFEMFKKDTKEYFESYHSIGIRYLEHEETIINIKDRNIRIYGEPYQPYFCNWAYNIKDLGKLKHIYSEIPEGLDILISHVPPLGILDQSFNWQTGEKHLGTLELKERLNEMTEPPKLHVFGHIHGSGGKLKKIDSTTYVNASVCDEKYNPTNEIITVEI